MPDNLRIQSACKILCLVLLAFAACANRALAQKFTILHTFNGSDGNRPTGPLVQGLDGRFYGTTLYGGGGSCPFEGNPGCGTIFKAGRDGLFRTLYHFCATTPCPERYVPNPLFEGTFGVLYGTTRGSGPGRAGSVFKFTPGEATLYDFCTKTPCSDGALPWAGVVRGEDGDFYGTTVEGGVYAVDSIGLGTIFKLTPRGAETVLHDFVGWNGIDGANDGAYPFGGLILASDGNFYGTSAGFPGYPHTYPSTVFKITPAGTYTLLASLTQADLYSSAEAPLVEGKDGNFYGTSYSGNLVNGSSCGYGCGYIFKVTPAGVLTILYDFCSQTNCADGGLPSTGLIQATDGNFYGTASSSGKVGANGGTIFRITPSGSFTVLHTFNDQELTNPQALLQATDGALYGVTATGGAQGDGTIFRLDVGLPPFVHPVLVFGEVGNWVTILGTNLTGATAVSFNGTAAAFKVWSASEIATKVPAGATTGKITVTTPDGTLSSDVVFRVISCKQTGGTSEN